MKIETTDSYGSFCVIDNNKKLLSGSYENFFYKGLKAEVNKTNITILPIDNWHSKFEIKSNEMTVGDIVFNWNGDIIINTKEKIKGNSEWIVKKRGFTSFHFEVIDKSDEIQLLLKPTTFDYKKFRFNYQIEIQKDNYKDYDDFLNLVLYSIFGVNLYKAKQDNMEI